MGDRTGRIISRRARVDHVASDQQWLWYLVFVIYYMFVCVVPSSHARARRKSAIDFSFILCFSNASYSLKVQDTSPES